MTAAVRQCGQGGVQFSAVVRDDPGAVVELGPSVPQVSGQGPRLHVRVGFDEGGQLAGGLGEGLGRPCGEDHRHRPGAFLRLPV